MPSVQNLVVVSFPMVDLKSLQTTEIMRTLDGTQRFIPMFVHFETIEAPSLIVVKPLVSVGTNASNYNNIMTNADLTGILDTLLSILSTPNQVVGKNVSTSGAMTSLPKNTPILMKVSLAATCTGNYKVRPDVLGYYV